MYMHGPTSLVLVYVHDVMCKILSDWTLNTCIIHNIYGVWMCRGGRFCALFPWIFVYLLHCMCYTGCFLSVHRKSEWGFS